MKQEYKILISIFAILMLGIGVIDALPNTERINGFVIYEVSGKNSTDIKPTVDAFRTALGPNNGVGGSFTSGRREINWDGVPDNFAAPNLLPPNFFNKNSPRGVVLFTPGTGFEVSANKINPTNTPVRFGNINPIYPKIFQTFSPERLFTALNSEITEIVYFVPGTNHVSTVNGFGAVFTNVRKDDTKIEYYDVNGNLLFSRNVLKKGSLSFLGVKFAGPGVFIVRITSGSQILGPKNKDVVVMDDFIYGEPQQIK